MLLKGRIRSGVVEFDQPTSLPEGTVVYIEPVLVPIRTDASDWDAAMRAANELEDYDFDAWRTQREHDLHMPMITCHDPC